MTTEKDNSNTTEIERTASGSLKGIGGRPPGAKNKTTLFKEAMRDGFEEKLMKDGQKVFDACVEKALDGDTSAMKMIMDRIIPIADVQGTVGKGTTQININVSGMEATVDLMDGDVVDAEYTEE